MSAPPHTILVIDDSLTYREALREGLEAACYRVLTAENGMEGLRLAAEAEPAGIILDGVLPDIDGIAVLHRLRAMSPIPCLFLTGMDDAGTERKARAAGANGFARKGEDLDRIVAQLRDMLEAWCQL